MSGMVVEVLEILERRGTAAYGGEAVSQREHAFQAAMLAEADGAAPALIAAALLHDIGHLIEESPGSANAADAFHEHLGAAFLRRAFPPAVSEPVGLHVPAKRYLCAIEPGYRASLSPMSEHTLLLQGGPMDKADAAAFRASPYAEAAVAVRRWDDKAKVPGLRLTDLAHYRPILDAALRG
jgi:phosphonate degradation associated HDIG domain protein